MSHVLSVSQSQEIPDLQGILNKAQGGSQEAFGQIYDLYFKKIYRFIFFRVGHKESAEDLTEEVFLKAFSKIGSIKETKAFEGWLYQIARNLVIDYYRQKKLTVALDEIENTLEYESNVVNNLDLEQDQKVLLRHMKELPSDQQVVIKLKFFDDLENHEIAELLNKTEGSIRVIQHRAINKLQELIQSNEDER